MEALKLVDYDEYAKIDDGLRYEIYDGFIYAMSPAPTTIHQDIVLRLARPIANYLHNKQCKIYIAPFDVRLSEKNADGKDIESVLQPDITIVCDRSKIDRKGCFAAPDMVIEVSSPSTAERDLKVKFALYERFGVKEYWIASSSDNILMVYLLGADGKYNRAKIYSRNDIVKVGILPELEINLIDVFENEASDY